VRGHDPARIRCGLDKLRRYGIARRPQLHRLVVDRIGAAQNLSARIGGITVDAKRLQPDLAARLVVRWST
jgi:hypothetical protein